MAETVYVSVEWIWNYGLDHCTYSNILCISSVEYRMEFTPEIVDMISY